MSDLVAEPPSVSRPPRRSGRLVVRGARHLLRLLCSAPLSSAFALVLFATTLVLATSSDDAVDRILDASSTDVAHLGHDPLVVLVLSALWLPGREWVPYALVIAAAGAPLERRMGSLALALVFLSAHVLATLVTEASVAVGVAHGWLPTASVHRFDVGASYGMVAVVVACAGVRTEWPRWRRTALAVVGVFLVTGVPDSTGMTEWGHLISAVIGACWWPVLRRRRPATSAWLGSAAWPRRRLGRRSS